MNGQPSKKQAEFHKWCRELGCIVSARANPAIHHISGARMKLKGVKGFAGEWLVLPLHYDFHQGKNGVHTSKRVFEAVTEGTEKEHWVNLISLYEEAFGRKPMPEIEYQIILQRG